MGIGLPLFDLKLDTFAYEKHLDRSRKKLGSRFAVGHLTLKQVHTMESDVQSGSPIKPSVAASSKNSSFTRPAQNTTVLSRILRNDRKMTSLNHRKDSLSSPL